MTSPESPEPRRGAGRDAGRGPDTRVVAAEQSLLAILLAAGFVFGWTWCLVVALLLAASTLLGPASPVRRGVAAALDALARGRPGRPVPDRAGLRTGEAAEAIALLVAVLTWPIGIPAVGRLIGLVVAVFAAFGAAFSGWPVARLHRKG